MDVDQGSDCASKPFSTASSHLHSIGKAQLKTVNGDLLDEENETFSALLSTPVNATIADNEGIVTITDVAIKGYAVRKPIKSPLSFSPGRSTPLSPKPEVLSLSLTIRVHQCKSPLLVRASFSFVGLLTFYLLKIRHQLDRTPWLRRYIYYFVFMPHRNFPAAGAA
jgi:hypothetical protein